MDSTAWHSFSCPARAYNCNGSGIHNLRTVEARRIHSDKSMYPTVDTYLNKAIFFQFKYGGTSTFNNIP